MLVCNGETPCPTLFAIEGDILELTVHNDLYAQSSVHWCVFPDTLVFLVRCGTFADLFQ